MYYIVVKPGTEHEMTIFNNTLTGNQLLYFLSLCFFSLLMIGGAKLWTAVPSVLI